MDVKLEWYEVAMASHVGWLRQVQSVRNNLKNSAGFNGAGWTEHCEGACGEYAVAKVLGIPWTGTVDTFKSDDLPGIQVRTRSKHNYDLIVRKHDSDTAIWILVTGISPNYKVHGWILGADAKKQQWLREYAGRPEAFFVPTSELKPMSELKMPSCADG
jgi:hypothetical protein